MKIKILILTITLINFCPLTITSQKEYAELDTDYTMAFNLVSEANSKNLEGLIKLINKSQANRTEALKFNLDTIYAIANQPFTGHTLLTWIVQSQGQKENEDAVNMINFLVGKGANVNLKNKYGKTPLMIAIDSKNQFLITLLEILGEQTAEDVMRINTSNNDTLVPLTTSLRILSN